jgi:hypothetical protein
MARLEDSWEEFALNVGGRFEVETSGRWMFKSRTPVVDIPLRGRRLRLARRREFAVEGQPSYITRMSVSLGEQLSWSWFKVRRSGRVGRLLRWALDEESLGVDDFDRRFVAEGLTYEPTQALFKHGRVQAALRDALSAGIVECREGHLIFEEQGELGDVQRLKRLYGLFDVLLERMDELALATGTPESGPS